MHAMDLVVRKLAVQVDDALALGRGVGDGSQFRQPAEFENRVIARRHELGRVAVADRNRAGLVEQQGVDVARHFHRFAALGQDIGAQSAVHAGNADGGQQRADGGGYQADQQSHQRRDVGSQSTQLGAQTEVAGHVHFRLPSHWPQGHRDQQENERKGGEHERQGNFIGRALTNCSFDQCDHAIEKRTAGAGRNLDDDLVRQHARAAGYARAVATRFADHGRRLPRDRRLVDRSKSLDDFSIAGNDFTGVNDDFIAGEQGGGKRQFDRSIRLPNSGRCFASGLAERVGLRLAPRFGQRGGEIGEQHGQRQPNVERHQVGERSLARSPNGLNREQDAQHGADLDHEHHRVLPLDVRP